MGVAATFPEFSEWTLLVALYKTATDQNVDTTRSNPIHFILGFAVRVAKSR